jgi:geranylgeranyl diphosphate synthase type II
MDDLSAEGRFGSSGPEHAEPIEFLKQIHRRKTSAMIEVSLELGGLVGRASADQLAALQQYGQAIGLAFQIVDDCLDVESTAEQLGKTTRKDSNLGKLTYPGLVGLEKSKQMASQLIDQACRSLAILGAGQSRLESLARFVLERNK